MIKKKVWLPIIGTVAFALLTAGCASSRRGGTGGELVGVPLSAWQEPQPLGMVLIPRGSIVLGHTENDSVWGLARDAKAISVDAFWMDQHEITNAQYRQFVYYVRDSIIRERLADPAFGGNPDYKITTDRYGDPLEHPYLDWSRQLPNERRAFDEELAAMKSVYYTNPVTGEKKLDPAQMLYTYTRYDYHAAALYDAALIRLRMPHPADYNPQNDPSLPMIAKDTAYVDDSGIVVRKTLTRRLSGEYDFLNTYIVAIYPDESCWVNDFPNAHNEQYARLYFNHPGYDNYPVVGVSWEQAEAFCAWRSRFFQKGLNAPEGTVIESFRLPTEAEWEYAARAGDSNRKYPWTAADVDRDGGCYNGNFKPGEGDYTPDGYLITAQSGSYPPNDFGLYDMAGNVSEWTSTAYSASAYKETDDINPELRYDADMQDPLPLKQKVVRGGSWKDVARFIQSATRGKELQNKQRSYIGFRCVRSAVSFKPADIKKANKGKKKKK